VANELFGRIKYGVHVGCYLLLLLYNSDPTVLSNLSCSLQATLEVASYRGLALNWVYRTDRLREDYVHTTYLQINYYSLTIVGKGETAVALVQNIGAY
jgi:hypothetical protein